MSPKEKNSENEERHNRIMSFIRAHEWRRQLLTGLALAISVLTVTVGIGLALWYRVVIEPRIGELQDGYSQYRERLQTSTNSVAQTPTDESQMEKFRRNRDYYHMVMTHALGVETMWIGISVALVGVGTLITALLIVVTRRVTLRQINESLVTISKQLKELENR